MSPQTALVYKVIPVTPLVQNCSLLWCPRTRRGAAVDPGGEAERIRAEARRAGVQLERVLLTHAHIDHVGAAGALGVPVEGPHRADAFLVDLLEEQSGLFAVPLEGQPIRPQWLADGEVVRFGDVELEVLHCPGHTPGHVVYYHRAGRLALTGDVLFQGSVGRTDLPGGNFETLVRSIRQRLFTLGDEVAFIPGHGPMSTLGAERRTNPFVGADA
ncbi:MAG: MBL fold metallo-hydrolase [Candidatus Latescibacterota bacterium]